MQQKRNKAQTILGYLLIFIVVMAALIVISKYVRNSMSGKIRQAGDSIGGGAQYDPGSGIFSTGMTTTGANDDTGIND